jgi:gliding motility-associated-like protein
MQNPFVLLKPFIGAGILILFSILRPSQSFATHILGGELSWTCQGNGAYIFDLILYRDCNGFDVTIGSENISVWNHPSVTQIPVNFISRVDMSPYCEQVAGSPVPFACGSGSNGGNGTGAVERVLYRSNPIVLPGNPGAAGWVFTFTSFFRSANITNLQNPGTTGITIVAKMFNSGANGTCNDSSPRFYEPPYVVACAGVPYSFNPNVYDPDLDSLVFALGEPLDQIITSYNPPSDPVNINFVSGFSVDSPTPSAFISPGSVPAVLNASNGTLTFNSTMAGNYVIMLNVRAYRSGVLISENQLEFQVAVENCLVANNPPVVTPPFNGNTSFETTVMAGDLVNFNLIAQDLGVLHNGAPQSTFIYASGAQFAQVITNAGSGCANPPCATLNTNVPASGSPSAAVDFSWQTACNHLVGATGQVQNSVPYNFVFRVQDDLCQIPAVQYVTVVINVVNSALPSVPELTCIDVLPNGDVTLNWTPSVDPSGGFVQYEIRTLQNGLIASIPNINTSTYTHVGAGADLSSLSYYILATGGCGGLFSNGSDTISTVFLEVNNPGTGYAFLDWPNVSNPNLWGSYAYIEMEYPAGVWTVIDSVPIGLSQLNYEITICEAFLNFRIVLENASCTSHSNIDGDNFEDQIPPPIPVIESVSVDTVTGDLIITWNVSPSPDTYGYIVYDQDGGGFYVDLDTIWGRFNNSHGIAGLDLSSALSFTVAAFDSCFTDQFPPTYQTSGKADIHTTMYLTGVVNICEQTIDLNWTPYLGWPQGVQLYRVFIRPDGGNWILAGTSTVNSTQISILPDVNYQIAVEAVSESGFTSFSQSLFISYQLPGAPDIHYLATASVEGSEVQVLYYSSFLPGQGKVIFQKWNPVQQSFEDLEERVVVNLFETFIDANHKADERSERYRFMAIDSCNNPTFPTNIGKTIFLTTQADQARLSVTLQWSPYEQFSAPIVAYRIFRSVNGIMDYNPIAVVPPNTRTYLDNLEEFGHTTGEYCYYVEAVEGFNMYSFDETSKSNLSCALLEPLIYIPNTIIINGINNVFLPVLNFYDFNSYELTILDRWGQVMFRANNPNEGWDGKHSVSQNIMEGTYVYVLRIRDGQDTEITTRGHVNVLVGAK